MVDYIKALYGLYVPEKSEGQGLVEYALIIALVSLVAAVALALLGDEIATVFSDIVDQLSGSV